MPYALKRPSATDPRIKEWQDHDPDGDTYVEIVKYKTMERAETAAAAWGGNVSIIEVEWSPGQEEATFPDYIAPNTVA